MYLKSLKLGTLKVQKVAVHKMRIICFDLVENLIFWTNLLPYFSSYVFYRLGKRAKSKNYEKIGKNDKNIVKLTGKKTKNMITFKFEFFEKNDFFENFFFF